MKAAIKDLETMIESSTKTAIRMCIATSRYIAKKEELAGVSKSKGAFIMIANDNQATFGGHGPLLQNFLKFRQLIGFPGENAQIVQFGDAKYDTSQIRQLQFAETYYGMNYNVTKRK